MTPEHRRVAAYLLRDEEVRPPAEEAGAPLPGAEAVPAQRAWQPAQGVWAWVHNRHNSRDFVAFAALLKLSLILLTLTAFAPEFQESGGNQRPVGGQAASVFGRAAPGVPVRAAEEFQAMNSVKRSTVIGASTLSLAFALNAEAQQAIQWKPGDGGNAHWYQRLERSQRSWTTMKIFAQSLGAHLATLTSESEAAFAASLLEGGNAFIGGYQDVSARDYSEPAGGWRWVTGEPMTWTAWCGGEPNDFWGRSSENVMGLYPQTPCWVDLPDPMNVQFPVPYVLIEWSADCNGDGIVDYGQILSGELADSNGNNIPDCCEDGSACVSSLVANASFEAGSPLVACASESITAPNMLGSAWQVSAGTVDRVRGGTACANSTQPKFGDYAVDLCGTPASSGAIRQIVATIPGHKYRCVFWLSGDASAGPAAKKVHAKVGTYIDLSYTFACSGTGAQAWVANQFEFTARGASETLEFAADNGVTTGGPMLDAINLADITTQCVGDIDASGEVDGADISLLLLNFGPCSTTP